MSAVAGRALTPLRLEWLDVVRHVPLSKPRVCSPLSHTGHDSNNRSSTGVRPRSIHSRDRCNFDGSERLRLTQRVMNVGGSYNALSHEENPELMSVTTGPQGNCPGTRRFVPRANCAPNRPPD